MKIVIADDSRVMRQIVTRTLRQAGFSGNELVEAADGQEAYDAIIKENPDLILSDWNMPNMTGVEVLRAIRRDGLETPFGFVTSEGTEQMREIAASAGALFLIAKPFTADQFRDALEPILG
jgi:two-component system, chemotaxis family, chemotaxis protein CheY